MLLHRISELKTKRIADEVNLKKAEFGVSKILAFWRKK